MKPDVKKALETIKQACGSVVANLETHQVIQGAVQLVEAELSKNKEK